MIDDQRCLALNAALHARLMEAFEDMVSNFNAAVAQPTSPYLDRLRDATDRCMRAIAGVRLAVERVNPGAMPHSPIADTGPGPEVERTQSVRGDDVPGVAADVDEVADA